jgi:putative oxidoreductase
MLTKLVRTDADYTLTIARVVLGALFFIHGDQLMLGWFGGYGLNGSLQFFSQQLGIPVAFSFLAICAEFFGGLLLIAGLMGRAAALAIICTMAVAVAKVHWQFGLFMNWFGTQKGEGFEYHLLTITLGLVILLKGSGALSLDRMLARLRGGVPAEMIGVTRTGASAMASRA